MNVSALFKDIDYLCHSTSGSYLTGDKLRNINFALQDVARVIWDSTGEWQYDDKNYTDLPIATTTLVNNQQDYSLPSTLQRIRRVEINDSSGNYQLLKQIDWSTIPVATSEYFGSAGTPVYYDMVGNSVFLYPTPASGYVTLVSGLKVYFDRDVVELTAVSATPGFAKPFHRVLSYSAALDYTKDSEERNFFLLQKSRIEETMKNFYAKRNVDLNTNIKPKDKKLWRQYQ